MRTKKLQAYHDKRNEPYKKRCECGLKIRGVRHEDGVQHKRKMAEKKSLKS